MKKFLMYICISSAVFSTTLAKFDPFNAGDVVEAAAKAAVKLPILGISLTSALAALPCATLTAISVNNLRKEYKEHKTVLATIGNNKATTTLGLFGALSTFGFGMVALKTFRFARTM
ncbi:MAG: hypothetical protein WC707_00020 [Candidatus Babeliaceae bacterium]|jgi:hypothetical protein